MPAVSLRRLASTLLTVLLFATAAWAAGPEETWYAEAFTQADGTPTQRAMWSKGRKFRDQIVVAGIPATTIVSGDTYYAIDELHGVGVAIQRSPKALALDAKGGRPFLDEAARIEAEGAEKVRTERIGGRACDVYRITNDDGKREAWLTQDALRLPVRIEVYSRATDTTSLTYVNWQRGLEIPDAFFEPDPRVRLERMTWQEYVERLGKGPVGPVPILYGDLLLGPRS